MGQVAKLGGFCLWGSADIVWKFTQGTNPYMITVELLNEHAEKLIAGANPVTLRIESDDRPPLEIKDVYVHYKVPTSDPYKASVLISDKRWLWARKHIVRRYNMRRHTANRRQVEGQILSLETFVDDVAYIKSSLNNGKPWQASEILKDIFSLIQPDAEVPAVLPTVADQVVEDLELDFQGDQALAVALQQLPDIEVYVNKDGQVKVTDRNSGAESDVLAATMKTPVRRNEYGGRVQGGGTVILQNNKRIRPKYIEVLFTRELEVRFTYDEDATQTPDGRFLVNVFQLPDLALTVGGKEYSQGTWLPFGDIVYDAWGAGPANLPPITRDIINSQMVLGLLSMTYGEIGNEVDPHTDWRQRIGAITHHYYQTFQINRRWMDRVLSWKPYRAGLVDPENARFASSPVWQDYSVKPSMRGILRDPTKTSYAYNVFGYNANTASCKLAPARISVEDDELGILRVRFTDHPLGWTEEYYPSAINLIPVADVSNVNNRIDKQGLFSFRAPHQMSTIVTMVPGWPNSTAQLHSVKIQFKDIKPNGILANDEEGEGPPLQVRVPSQFPARFAWLDSHSADVEAAFGLPEGKVDDNPDQLSRKLDSLLVNDKEVNAIAEAVALWSLMPYRDRIVGQVTEELKADAEPKGQISEIVHQLSDARSLTIAVVRPDAAEIPWLSLLPADVRRTVLHQVQVK